MEHRQICESIIQKVLATAGKDAKVEVTISQGGKKSLGLLKGNPQSYEQAQSRSLSLSVYLGQKCATTVGLDFSEEGLNTLVEKTVQMAQFTPENKDAFLAKPGEFITNANEIWHAFDMVDDATPKVEDLLKMANTFEQGALSVKGVNQCETVQVYSGTNITTTLTSEGFYCSLPSTVYSAYLSALAGKPSAQVRAGNSALCRHLKDLPDLFALGQKTGHEAVAKIGAKPIKSGKMPVVFHKDIAADFLDMFAAAIDGMAVDKGVTYLKDALGTKVFSDHITIVDDPTLVRGLGSSPCDDDGVASTPLTLVEDGVLKCWLLGIDSAKRLGLKANGRGDGTTNLYMQPGTLTEEELIATIPYGLYVTDTIGHGHDSTTGDFSRGAEGFLIKDGKLNKAVNEITIAGNLKDIFKTITPADNLTIDDSTCAPTFKVDEMTVAGR